MLPEDKELDDLIRQHKVSLPPLNKSEKENLWASVIRKQRDEQKWRWADVLTASALAASVLLALLFSLESSNEIDFESFAEEQARLFEPSSGAQHEEETDDLELDYLILIESI